MTNPTLTVEIGHLTGWTLGVVGKSELGTTTNLASLTYDNITSKVRSLSIRRGRNHELDRVEAGTASVRLLNQDGAFNPTNTSSVYYPNIRPMIPLRIRATFFSPSDIAGLVAWYAMDESATLFTDTARTTPVTTDGDIIKGVTDKSGGGHHLSEATNGPQYKVSIINGRSVARFDGVNDVLKNAAMTADASQTIMIVAQKRSAPDTASRTLFGATADQAQLFTDSDNHATSYAYFSNEANGVSVLSGTATAVTAVVLRVNSASSMDFYANGGSATNIDPSGTITTATTYAYGANATSANPTDSDIGEVLIYDSALAAADLNNVGLYLAARWGFVWTTVS